MKRGDHLKCHSQRAMALFKEGYNCSQAVFVAFCEELGMDQKTALKLSSSFGGGMGRLREVCGAVSGMFMAAGLHYGYEDPHDKTAKAEHYKRIQKLAEQFKEENGSIICRELLGLSKGPDIPVPEDRTEAYYKKRPCAELVGCAAGILEKMMRESIEEEEEKKMKIILPVEEKSLDALVCPSFGRTPFFLLFNTENGEHEFLDNSAAMSQGGAGIKAAQMLADHGAEVVITYRCGENAAEVLNAAAIKIFKAQNVSVKENIARFKEGSLAPLTEIHAGFHNHGGAMR